MIRAILKGCFAVLAIGIGSAIVLWILENELFHRFSEYQRPRFPTAYAMPPIMIFVGFKWGTQALELLRKRRAEHLDAADGDPAARRR
jgi:hypothetical protein